MAKQVIFEGVKKGFMVIVSYHNPYSEQDLVHNIQGLTQERAKEYEFLINTLIRDCKFFGKSISKYYPELKEAIEELHREGMLSDEFCQIFKGLENKVLSFYDEIFGKVERNFIYDEDEPYPKDLSSYVYNVNIHNFEKDIPPIIVGE